MIQKTYLSCAISAAIGVAISNAAAQPANTVEPRVIEEIVVTAEKRAESLQTLSQAVTALTSRHMENKNVMSFVDLSAIAPGVTVARNEGFKTIISIRGVGNEANQNATANPSVSHHMDGMYVASPYALQTDFIDVERIEVLRGPQGTLFGQSSSAGAINVISVKPDFDAFSGKADVTLGSYNLLNTRGTVNIPISETFAMRTSVN
jgi:iron complex outermembrane receptor protein